MSEHTTEESTFEIVERAYTPEAQPEISAEIGAIISGEIGPAEVVAIADEDPVFDIDAIVAHMELLKANYTHRITAIETFLGFIVSEEDLRVRLARLEKFVGLGG